jgi:16S rRNA U1498 N3-methylase RsmE
MTVEEALELGQFYCRNLANHKQGAEAAATLARWKPFILAALEQSEHADNWETDTVPNWGRVVKAYRAAVSQESK